MLRLSMHADLNKVAGGLSLDEEKALLKTVPSLHREAQADLLRYFGGVKKQAKVLEWVLAGEAKVKLTDVTKEAFWRNLEQLSRMERPSTNPLLNRSEEVNS